MTSRNDPANPEVSAEVAAQMIADAAETQGTKPVDLKELHELGAKQVTLEARIKQLEADTEQAKRDLKSLRDNELPRKMKACGLLEFTMDSGFGIECKPIVVGSLPLPRLDDDVPWAERQRSIERHEAALTVVRDHQGADLIKTEVKIRFARGQEALVARVTEYLRGINEEIDWEQRSTIHPQTYLAWVREQLAKDDAGKPLPLSLLGVETLDRTKVRKPKVKKVRSNERS